MAQQSPKPRVKLPRKADVITIKTLLRQHEMETAQRKHNQTGASIPRKIIAKFVAKFNSRQFFAVDIEPAVSTHPFFEFNVKVTESGTFEFQWVDDEDPVYAGRHRIEVE